MLLLLLLLLLHGHDHEYVVKTSVVVTSFTIVNDSNTHNRQHNTKKNHHRRQKSCFSNDAPPLLSMTNHKDDSDERIIITTGQHKQHQEGQTQIGKERQDQNGSEVGVGEIGLIGERYICLFDNYQKIKGPYFYALVDQLLEQTQHPQKHIAFCTTQADIRNIMNNNLDFDDRREDNDKDDAGAGADPDPDIVDDTNPFINTTRSITEDNNSRIMKPILHEIQVALGLENDPELFILDDWNPFKIEERFHHHYHNTSSYPSIIWVYGNCSPFYTRHMLRISGFDHFIQEQCASPSMSSNNDNNNDSCYCTSLYIGEGTGSLCAGYTMDTIVVNRTLTKNSDDDDDNDDVVVPELQKFGLQLLGYNDNDDDDDDDSHYYSYNYENDVENLKDNQVFVWSQQQHHQQQPDDQSASASASASSLISSSLSSLNTGVVTTTLTTTTTKFIITPSQKGTIEKYESISNPLPPLVLNNRRRSSNRKGNNDDEENEEEEEGGHCYGEPSIDPSKAIRVSETNLGITEEWW